MLRLQKWLKVDRNKGIEIRKGEVWVSITEKFVAYALSRKEEIYRRMRHTLLADELVWQTLAWNSPFRDRVYSLNDQHLSCMQEIDWKRGGPYVWGQEAEDYDFLMASNKLFARKFSSRYPDIIDRVYYTIQRLNE